MSERNAFLLMLLFGLGAVLIILYQHSQATSQVLGAIGVGQQQPNQAMGSSAPASLAGMPTIGQAGSDTIVPVQSLNIFGGGWLQ